MRLEPEVRILENTNDSDPVGVTHVIAGGPSNYKGKTYAPLRMSCL